MRGSWKWLGVRHWSSLGTQQAYHTIYNWWSWPHRNMAEKVKIGIWNLTRVHNVEREVCKKWVQYIYHYNQPWQPLKQPLLHNNELHGLDLKFDSAFAWSDTDLNRWVIWCHIVDRLHICAIVFFKEIYFRPQNILIILNWHELIKKRARKFWTTILLPWGLLIGG